MGAPPSLVICFIMPALQEVRHVGGTRSGVVWASLGAAVGKEVFQINLHLADVQSHGTVLPEDPLGRDLPFGARVFKRVPVVGARQKPLVLILAIPADPDDGFAFGQGRDRNP